MIYEVIQIEMQQININMSYKLKFNKYKHEVINIERKTNNIISLVKTSINSKLPEGQLQPKRHEFKS